MIHTPGRRPMLLQTDRADSFNSIGKLWHEPLAQNLAETGGGDWGAAALTRHKGRSAAGLDPAGNPSRVHHSPPTPGHADPDVRTNYTASVQARSRSYSSAHPTPGLIFREGLAGQVMSPRGWGWPAL